jgi:hypothetical protein
MWLPDDAKVFTDGEGHEVQIDGGEVYPKLLHPRIDAIHRECPHHLLLHTIEPLLENERDLRCGARGVVQRWRGERRRGKGWEWMELGFGWSRDPSRVREAWIEKPIEN